MKRNLAVNTAISAAIHILIIAALLAFSFVSYRSRRRPAEITTFIEIHQAQPAEAAAQVVSEPKPPTPKPPVSSKKPVEVSKRVVQRAPPAQEQNLSAEQIRKLFSANERSLQTTSKDSFRDYLTLIKAILYEAWSQPSSLSGQSGLATRARLRVALDGRITSREIISSSGNDLMDSSVVSALETVAKLPPLPPGWKRSEEITIDFELTPPAAHGQIQ